MVTQVTYIKSANGKPYMVPVTSTTIIKCCLRGKMCAFLIFIVLLSIHWEILAKSINVRNNLMKNLP